MNTEKPDPPTSIPKYIREGIDRQDTGTLEDIIEYCHARIDWQTRDVETDELAEADEEVVDVDGDEKRGTIVTKKIPCGKDCSGCPHGPYQYRVTRRGDTLKWEYLGKVDS
ncbi:hypothetical protein [Halomarina ordinaria]|uniref:DUF6788 domain-containing protein n=1 Tax=Halomarina ordinaria TaxID=3033939 RepID=A0ABD5UGN6_9EURY|nr:hypothetical protein [Halomarina sp. PSRA2]